MKVLGIDALFHDPAAALVAYSYDPALARPAEELGLHDLWDHLRQTYAQRATGSP